MSRGVIDGSRGRRNAPRRPVRSGLAPRLICHSTSIGRTRGGGANHQRSRNSDRCLRRRRLKPWNRRCRRGRCVACVMRDRVRSPVELAVQQIPADMERHGENETDGQPERTGRNARARHVIRIARPCPVGRSVEGVTHPLNLYRLSLFVCHFVEEAWPLQRPGRHVKMFLRREPTSAHHGRTRVVAQQSRETQSPPPLAARLRCKSELP